MFSKVFPQLLGLRGCFIKTRLTETYEQIARVRRGMNRSGSAEARTIGIYNCDNVHKCAPSEVILTYERRNTFVGPRDYSNAVMTIILGYQNIIAKRNGHRPKVNWQCRRCRRAHCHDYASTSLKLHDENFLD
jgi:hypothetical protein